MNDNTGSSNGSQLVGNEGLRSQMMRTLAGERTTTRSSREKTVTSRKQGFRDLEPSSMNT